MASRGYVGDLLAMLSKRQRAKLRGRIKRHFRLNRRQIGAIGAGHLEAPNEYRAVLLGVLELIRFRRGERPSIEGQSRVKRRLGRTGGVYTRRHAESDYKRRARVRMGR
jgi:hypothetical protein